VSPLPVWAHEALVAPAAFGLAFAHSRRGLGNGRAAVELLCLVLYGYALEWVAMAVFRSHSYGDAWQVAPGGVPVAVAAVWAALIASAMALSARLGLRSIAARAAAAALLGITLDLLMEPVAMRAGLWRWTPPGPWLGVPVGNFVGWAVIVGSYTAGAELWTGSDHLFGQALRRALLGALSVAALIGVGLAWTRAGAEQLLIGAGGWLFWAFVLAATAGLGFQRRPATTPETLAGRLGAASGRSPALVFLILAAAFTIDALALGGAELALVALATLAVLGLVASRSGKGMIT
jgi:uncharacterized membrane protein